MENKELNKIFLSKNGKEFLKELYFICLKNLFNYEFNYMENKISSNSYKNVIYKNKDFSNWGLLNLSFKISYYDFTESSKYYINKFLRILKKEKLADFHFQGNKSYITIKPIAFLDEVGKDIFKIIKLLNRIERFKNMTEEEIELELKFRKV